jgi:light-regulated signal transduction histidine kinase (bacteriophytochrome)
VTAGLFGAYAEVVETGEPLVREDFDDESVSGGRRLTRAFDIRAMKLADGIVVTWRDVTDRRQAAVTLARQAADLKNAAAELEERVRLRTAELVSSNREFEVFSYSVAHDLRAPLRAIHGYSQILLDDHAGQLDEDGQVLLGGISRYIERMGQLIEGLLALAGVGRSDLGHASIDMTALVESTVAVLRAAQAGRWPRIVVARLPDAIGDPALIGQAWANLISNAVKFCADQPAAEVRVESETTGEEIIYHVRDNGAGFDMTYAAKLFGVFQRLHSATDFAGNGIGLAIVARIVERHGGRVWAEGRVNGGACFSFALPIVPAD